MTLCGGYQEGGDVIAVTSHGGGAADGWTVVMEFDDANLPSGNNREGFFYVTGGVGMAANTGASAAAKIQIGIRLKGTAVPFDHQVLLESLTAATIQKGAETFLQGIPFCASAIFESGGRGNYNPAGTTELELVARVFRDGDPSTITIEFDVFRPRMMYWDLATLGGANYFFEEFKPAIGTALGVAAPALNTTKVIHTSSAIPFDPTFGEENWLVLTRVTYMPTTSTSALAKVAPVLEYAYGTAPISTVRLTPNVTKPQSIYRDSKWFGCNSLAGGSAGFRYTISQGTFDVVKVPDDTIACALRGWDPAMPSSGGTLVIAIEWFGVRLSALARVSFRQRRDDRTFGAGQVGGSPAPEFFNGNKVTERTNENFEPLLPGVIGNLMVAAFGVNTRTRSSTNPPSSLALLPCREHIGTNKGQVIYSSGLHWVQGAGSISGKGNRCHIGIGRQTNVGEDEPQIVHTGAEHMIHGTSALKSCGMDSRLIAWSFELDPTIFEKNRTPPPPPTVVVIPGREAVDLTSLTALPQEPESILPEVVDPAAGHQIANLMGYRVSWPAFVVARSIYTFTFVCTETQRVALVSFFEDLADRAFKYTPRKTGATPVAYAAIGGPTESMVSSTSIADRGSFTVSIRAVELLWVGVNT